MTFTSVSPKLFHGHPVLDSREGYVCLSRRDGREVWALEAEQTHFVRCMPEKQLMTEFLYLFTLAVQNNLRAPKFEHGTIAVPDWGTSYLQGRLKHGWCGALDDLCGTEEVAVAAYPYAVLWQVNVNDIVIPAGGRGVVVDSRYALEHDRILKEFPTLQDYITFVRMELNRSLKEFTELHGDEIDRISLMIAEHEGPCSARPEKIVWPS